MRRSLNSQWIVVGLLWAWSAGAEERPIRVGDAYDDLVREHGKPRVELTVDGVRSALVGDQMVEIVSNRVSRILRLSMEPSRTNAPVDVLERDQQTVQRLTAGIERMEAELEQLRREQADARRQLTLVEKELRESEKIVEDNQPGRLFVSRVREDGSSYVAGAGRTGGGALYREHFWKRYRLDDEQEAVQAWLDTIDRKQRSLAAEIQSNRAVIRRMNGE